MSDSPYWCPISSPSFPSLEDSGVIQPRLGVCAGGKGSLIICPLLIFHAITNPAFPEQVVWASNLFPLKGHNKTLLNLSLPHSETPSYSLSLMPINCLFPRPERGILLCFPGPELLKGNSYRVAAMHKRKTSTCLRMSNQVVPQSPRATLSSLTHPG